MATMKVEPKFMTVRLDLAGVVGHIIRRSFHAMNDEVEEIGMRKGAGCRRPP